MDAVPLESLQVAGGEGSLCAHKDRDLGGGGIDRAGGREVGGQTSGWTSQFRDSVHACGQCTHRCRATSAPAFETRTLAYENRIASTRMTSPGLADAISLIEGIVRALARRSHASADEAEELLSRARLKLVENDGAVLAKFGGRSSLRTYLTTIVQRLLLDLRRQEWGLWRPSAAARRLGPLAVRLEQLMHRDGRSLEEAAGLLACDGGSGTPPGDLASVAAQLPRRVRLRIEGEETLATVHVGSDVTEAAVRSREATERGLVAEQALRSVLDALTPREQLILRLRFHDGFTVRQIARTLHLEEKALYRSLDRLLARMRTDLERRGLSSSDVGDLVGAATWEPQAILTRITRNESVEGV
jgi:RNA polymerase sigma factor (sigma-70 family)